MVGPSKHRVLVLASACALVGAALPGAVTAQQVTHFSGSVTDSQQLVKVAVGDAPMSPCGLDEVEIDWSAPTHTAVRSVTGDLIAGAELLTEEVEPGVLKVLSDGVRSTLGGNEDIAVAADGDVWVFKARQSYKLGDAESHEWENDLFDIGQDSSEDIEVAPDGTLWWADRDGDGLKSVDGRAWTVRRPAPKGEQGSVDQVEVLDDGTVLASWWSGGRGDGQREVGRLSEDGWQIIHSVGGSRTRGSERTRPATFHSCCRPKVISPSISRCSRGVPTARPAERIVRRDGSSGWMSASTGRSGSRSSEEDSHDTMETAGSVRATRVAGRPGWDPGGPGRARVVSHVQLVCERLRAASLRRRGMEPLSRQPGTRRHRRDRLRAGRHGVVDLGCERPLHHPPRSCGGHRVVLAGAPTP